MKRYRDEYVVCDACGWTGRESDAFPGDVTDDWYHVDCPNCHNESISEIKLPSYTANNCTITDADMQAELDDPLISQDQLPDIDGDDIILTWNVIVNDNDDYVVIKHNDSLVWKQTVSYECYIDFIQFCVIAKLRYGSRLTDVQPSRDSHQYLYGSCIQSVGYVSSVKKAFKKIKNNIN